MSSAGGRGATSTVLLLHSEPVKSGVHFIFFSIITLEMISNLIERQRKWVTYTVGGSGEGHLSTDEIFPLGTIPICLERHCVLKCPILSWFNSPNGDWPLEP